MDKIGTAFEAPSVASGYGAYIAQVRQRQIYILIPLVSSLGLFYMNLDASPCVCNLKGLFHACIIG